MLATSDYLNRPCRRLADVLKARAARAEVDMAALAALPAIQDVRAARPER